MTRKVVIDTNGLMIPGQFGVDIFSELNGLGFDLFLVPRAVVRELEWISSKGRGKDRKAAKLALTLLDKCMILEKDGIADDVVLDMSYENNAACLSNDIELKKRLCSKGVTIVHLREKTHLSV